MKSVPIALLRHATTTWNEEGRLQGLTDTGLSVRGEAEARDWRLPGRASGWRRVSSPLARARRTAELLRPAAAVSVDSRLREMSFGAWEGYTLAELRGTVGETFLDAERRGLDFCPPRGESPRIVMVRLSQWLADIARAGDPVVAVSHKAAIRALLALATGWDMTARSPLKLDWRCLHFFAVDSDGTVRVEHMNVPLLRSSSSCEGGGGGKHILPPSPSGPAAHLPREGGGA
jgi:probable phosphoglycerate mutase